MSEKTYEISLRLNGREKRFRVEERETLLQVLRERAGLTGAKKGCDLGECGACTVILNGRAVNSCCVFAVQADGGSVETIEGLGFAIPLDDVLNMLEDIMTNGQVTSHAYVGVTVDNAAAYPESGVRSGGYLVEIVSGGPADKAGLQAGDVITMVGTTTITSSQDLTSVLGSKSYKAGDTTTVTYIRAGQVYTTELTFGSTLDKPAEAEPQSNIPQQDGGNYEDYYGDMEDFFNQFFGRGYAA